MNIGQRAYQAICDRAKQTGRKILEEAGAVYVSKEVLWRWKSGRFEPRAYFLQQMALAGYDVFWVLTGEKMNVDLFTEENEAIIKHYEMPDAGVYIVRKEMTEIGCNIEEWNRRANDVDLYLPD